MTYEEKVRLFNAKRYLMPLPPLGTKNWTRWFIQSASFHPALVFHWGSDQSEGKNKRHSGFVKEGLMRRWYIGKS